MRSFLHYTAMNSVRRLAVAAFAAAFASIAAADQRPPLLCGGVEPSWSLDTGADQAVFTAPDVAQIDYAVPHVARAEGRAWPRVLTLLAQRDTALVILRPQRCSDTMSDNDFDWMIDVLTQRRGEAIALTGCCRVRPSD